MKKSHRALGFFFYLDDNLWLGQHLVLKRRNLCAWPAPPVPQPRGCWPADWCSALAVSGEEACRISVDRAGRTLICVAGGGRFDGRLASNGGETERFYQLEEKSGRIVLKIYIILVFTFKVHKLTASYILEYNRMLKYHSITISHTPLGWNWKWAAHVGED